MKGYCNRALQLVRIGFGAYTSFIKYYNYRKEPPNPILIKSQGLDNLNYSKPLRRCQPCLLDSKITLSGGLLQNQHNNNSNAPTTASTQIRRRTLTFGPKGLHKLIKPTKSLLNAKVYQTANPYTTLYNLRSGYAGLFNLEVGVLRLQQRTGFEFGWGS